VSNKIFDRTFDALAKTLDLRSQKQNIISSNIANSETPGYQAKRLDFENSLARALDLDDAPMDRSDPRHMSAGGEVGKVLPNIYNDPNNIIREDGNTVDRDAEMVNLAENQLMFQAAADLLKKKIGFIKYSIGEGGGGN
jgi:flagellar basal-body rod protein FlgB